MKPMHAVRPTLVFWLLLLAISSLPAQPPAPRSLPPGPLAAPVVEWVPDGKVLIAARNLLARFDLNSDQEELLDASGLIFALSPDGQRLALAGANRLELRRYADLAPLAALDSGEPADFTALAFSPDGRTLAAGTRAGHLHLWDVEAREQWADLAIEPAAAVTRLAFSADGARLLSAFEGGRAVLWDLEKQEVVQRYDSAKRDGADVEASVVALSPDGRRLLANELRGADAEFLLLDDQGRVLWRRAGYGVEFTPDGAAVLALAPPFRIAVLYRAADAEALRVFEPPEGVQALYLVRLSPDAAQLLGVGEDPDGQILLVWDFPSARLLKTRR